MSEADDIWGHISNEDRLKIIHAKQKKFSQEWMLEELLEESEKMLEALHGPMNKIAHYAQRMESLILQIKKVKAKK